MSSSNRLSTTKPKTPIAKKPTSGSPSKHLPTGLQTDPKAPIADKNEKLEKIDSPPTNLANQMKDLSNLIAINVHDNNILQDLNGSEMSILKMLEGDNQKEEEGEGPKLKEEVFSLKRELMMKNSLVEKLMNENNELRMEMDDMLTTVEDAKDKISIKLKECNQRIQELEGEINTLHRENQSYKDQLQKANQELCNKTGLVRFEEEFDRYQCNTQTKMDEFCQKVNEQIAQFLEASKGESANFNTSIQNRIEEAKKETNIVTAGMQSKNSAQSLSQSQSPGLGRSQNKAKTTMTKPGITPSHIKNKPSDIGSPGFGERVGSADPSSRRKKMMSVHNLNDIMPTNTSDYSAGATLLTNESISTKKSPKGPFIPNSKVKIGSKTEKLEVIGEKN
jgi:outer membrane murein-binding lipoprotein Lpp